MYNEYHPGDYYTQVLAPYTLKYTQNAHYPVCYKNANIRSNCTFRVDLHCNNCFHDVRSKVNSVVTTTALWYHRWLMDKEEWDVLWLYVTSYYCDRCSWWGWLIWLVLWSTITYRHILFTSFALVVQWIVALRSLLSLSGGQVDNFWRTPRIQGNEKHIFSTGSLCWQVGMWFPNNISGDYLYNDVLRL